MSEPNPASALPFAHGAPPLTATLRARAEDFVVQEELGFEASGDGEHVLLSVRKRHTNTAWVAERLADFAGVRRSAASFAGLKDRHALTTQSFSLHLPGLDEPDWSRFPYPEVEILASARHHRKLRRGALAGNRFGITLREARGGRDEAERRLAAIAAQGVPNYFGEQRFGLGGGNVARAEAAFRTGRLPRKQRSLLISAARSQIFNAVLAERVAGGTWNALLPGEVCCLAGSRSWFATDAGQVDLAQRLAGRDIHPSGPLWGRGEPPSREAAATLERRVAERYPLLAQGLAQQRLDQDRRPLRLIPTDMHWQWLEDDALRVSFALPAGSYATVVLRELADTTRPPQPPPKRVITPDRSGPRSSPCSRR